MARDRTPHLALMPFHPKLREKPWDDLLYRGATHHVFVIVNSTVANRWLGVIRENPMVRTGAFAHPHVQRWVDDIGLAQVYPWSMALYAGLPEHAAWQALGIRRYLSDKLNQQVALDQRAPAINRRTHVNWAAREYQHRRNQ